MVVIFGHVITPPKVYRELWGIVTSWRATPFTITLSIISPKQQVLRLLFRAAALLEQATPHGRSPLFVAAQRGTLWQQVWLDGCSDLVSPIIVAGNRSILKF